VLWTSIPSASIHYICSPISHFVGWHLFLAQGLLDTALHFLLKFIPWQQQKYSRPTVVTEVHKRLIAPYWSQSIFRYYQVLVSHILFQWLIKYLSLHLHTGNYHPLLRASTDSLLE